MAPTLLRDGGDIVEAVANVGGIVGTGCCTTGVVDAVTGVLIGVGERMGRSIRSSLMVGLLAGGLLILS